MEKVTINVLNNVKEDAKKNYELFEWKLIEEKNDLKETTLTFERDNSVSYYSELVKLENKFNRIYHIPSWVSYALIVVILIYVTTIAILWKCKAFDFDKAGVVLLMAIPTGVLLLVNTFITFLRSRDFNNHVNHKEEKYELYRSKISQLRNKKN